jgi:hypothetical protein
MGRRFAATLGGLAALVVFVVGVPVAAQEGFDPAECLAAIVAESDMTQAELAGLIDDLDTFLERRPEPTTAQLEEFLSGRLGRSVTLPPDLEEACTIYLVSGFGLDGDGGQRDGGEPPPRPPPGPPPGPPNGPITGADAITLTVIGLVLLGLGYMAVRRPRGQAT